MLLVILDKQLKLQKMFLRICSQEPEPPQNRRGFRNPEFVNYLPGARAGWWAGAAGAPGAAAAGRAWFSSNEDLPPGTVFIITHTMSYY